MSKNTGLLRCAVCHQRKPLNADGRCLADADQLMLSLPAVWGADGKLTRLGDSR